MYLVGRVAKDVIVKVLIKSAGIAGDGCDTHCFTVVAKVLASDGPEVISVWTCGEGCVCTSTGRTFYEFFRDYMRRLPFLSHLLETRHDQQV